MLAVLQNNLIEILLSIILMFNVGAYSFLWYKIRQIEEDVEVNEDSIIDVREALNGVWNRIFGMEDDPTAEGHLVETKDRFDYIDRNLEKISDQIEDINEERKEEHKKVRKDFRRLVQMLSNEEELDIDTSDFDF